MSPLLATALMYWELPLVILAISLVHGATRSDDWNVIFWETFKSVFRVAAFLGGIGLALYLMTWL